MRSSTTIERSRSWNGSTHRAPSSSAGHQSDSRKRKIQQIPSDIFMMIEESMLSLELKEAFGQDFIERPAHGGEVENTDDAVKFYYMPAITPSPGLIQWVKSKDILPTDALYDQIVPHLLPITAFLISNEDFLLKMIESDNGIDFPQLDQFVVKLLSKVKKHLPSDSAMRYIFIFQDIDKTINKIQRKVTDKSVPQLLDQALIHLLFTYDVEVIRCKKLCELSEYLHTVTRTLHNTIEKNCSSAFSIIMKASKLKPDEALNGKEKEDFEMRQTWAAMLQMVPQLSKDKANVFVENTRYSCPRKVFDAMNDENIPASERIQAMHTCFSKGKNGTIRQEPKLSRHIFKLMTVGDPDASLSEDP